MGNKKKKRKRPRKPCDPAWVGLGYDPITCDMYVICFDKTKEACEAKFNKPEYDTPTTYLRAFQLLGRREEEKPMDQWLGAELKSWLESCGVVHEGIIELIRGFGRTLRDILERRGRKR
jgi:hypothetical protein